MWRWPLFVSKYRSISPPFRCSSLATLVGATLAYLALSEMQEWIPSLLGLAAASMIYVAVADLIPGLHKRTELKATIQQVLLIGLGIASIAIVQTLVGE